MRFLLAAALLALAGAAAAGDAGPGNAKLAGIYEQDQGPRAGGDIDWLALSRSDAARRAQVQAVLAAGEVRTASDYYHAAMVFQHGDTLADYRLANALATLADPAPTIDELRREGEQAEDR